MINSDLYKTYKRFDTEPKVSIVSGDTFLIDNSPSCEPDAEAWQPSIARFPKRMTVVPLSGSFIVEVNMEGNWPEKDDPFTQTDLLDSKDREVQDLIYKIRTSRFIPHREKLANRLLTLFNDAKEEDPASLGIVFGSLHDFYNFLQLHTNLKYPSITLSPDNNILASWRSKQSQVFNVHFLSNKDVRFVIFKPNKKYPDRKFRFSGAATTDTLMDEIPKDMLDWIT